jgi:hypothetical protein
MPLTPHGRHSWRCRRHFYRSRVEKTLRFALSWLKDGLEKAFRLVMSRAVPAQRGHRRRPEHHRGRLPPVPQPGGDDLEDPKHHGDMGSPRITPRAAESADALRALSDVVEDTTLRANVDRI